MIREYVSLCFACSLRDEFRSPDSLHKNSDIEIVVETVFFPEFHIQTWKPCHMEILHRICNCTGAQFCCMLWYQLRQQYDILDKISYLLLTMIRCITKLYVHGIPCK